MKTKDFSFSPPKVHGGSSPKYFLCSFKFRVIALNPRPLTKFTCIILPSEDLGSMLVWCNYLIGQGLVISLEKAQTCATEVTCTMLKEVKYLQMLFSRDEKLDIYFGKKRYISRKK